MLPSRPASGAVRPPPAFRHECVDDAVRPTGVAKLMLSGELDASNCAHIADDVEWLCQQGFESIRIDLDGVEFIDAATVDTFVTAHRRAHAMGSELWLCRVRGLPLRVLQAVQLDDVLIEYEERRG